MGLYDVMNASISGMAAQSNLLATVSDNIANADTYGYKRAITAFETMVNQAAVGAYTAAGVTTRTVYCVAQQGILQGTTSVTDLAIQGNGFFVVSDRNGANYMTRAGSFVPDAQGNLINTAGFYLMGVDLLKGPSNFVANSMAGLSVIKIDESMMHSSPTKSGELFVNLNSAADIVSGSTPASNASGAVYTSKTSLVTFDNLGGRVELDVYMTKTADNTWEVTVYDKAGASAAGFPYAAGPLTTTTLTFNATDGKLATGSPTSLSIAIPGGQTMTLNMSKTTQLASAYTINSAIVDGSPPSKVNRVQIGSDGIVSYIFADGSKVDAYKIPLADVPSESKLTPVSGNVYSVNDESGPVQVGEAGLGGLGSINSGALERSTVDLATELTNMIQAQRGYTANSKVFQTGADLLQVIVNLK